MHAVPAQGAAPQAESTGAPPAGDPAAAMSARVFSAAVEGMDLAAIAIGDRLGYYAALDGARLTPPQLAAVTRTNARYTREWLEHQAVAGYVELIPGARGEEHSYRLSPGVAEVLARPGLLSSLAPLARQVAAAAAQWSRVTEGARTGHGLAWAEYGQDLRESQSDLNAPQIKAFLAHQWLPAALPETYDRLVAGDRVRVADVGCGGAWASIALADAFPTAQLDGYDLDPETVELARLNVAKAGHADRIRIIEGDVATAAPYAEYDLVVAFECIHDMAAPIEVLAGMQRMLRPGGRALVADMAGADELAADGDPVQRALYGFSLLLCLPDAMAGGAVDATGTVLRPATMNRYSRVAGFSDIEVVPIEHDFWRFYALRP
jgi:SAM-dependent methyltransferase